MKPRRKPTPRSTTKPHGPARQTQLHQAAQLLHEILSGSRPADKQMETFFRQNPSLGQRERGWLAETVYGSLRHLRSLWFVASDEITGPAVPASISDCTALVAAHCVMHQGYSGRALNEAGYRADTAALVTRARTTQPTTLPFAVRHDLPDWLAQCLIDQCGEEQTALLAAALKQAAPVDLRVNTLKMDRDSVAASLTAAGYPVVPTPYSPVGLRRQERNPLFATPAFREGGFEVQDEGSQLLGYLVEPRRRETVVDFCAGSGGKTLHLAALMANTGTLYASDTSEKRLERMRGRLKRAGVNIVRTLVISNEDDQRWLPLAGKAARVLVDAPCSGTGTLRRNPDIKWRTLDLATLCQQQAAILNAAARLVSPKGRLIYATCSLLRAENEMVVTAFLAQHPHFRLIPAQEALLRRHIPLPASEDGLFRLYPHVHGTDGFFAAVLEHVAIPAAADQMNRHA